MTKSSNTPTPRKKQLTPRKKEKGESIQQMSRRRKGPFQDNDSDYEEHVNSIEETSEEKGSDDDEEHVEEESNELNEDLKNNESNEENEEIHMDGEDNVEIEVSKENPFINSWFLAASTEQFHERNDSCKTHNVIIITPNRWQGDKKPTEVMAKVQLEPFRNLNPMFINYNEHQDSQLVRCHWEFMFSVFMKIHVKCKAKFMQVMIKQLTDDLKMANPKRHKFPKNWREFVDWHKSLEGATMDYEAWNSRQKPFDSKKFMGDIAKDFMIDLGIGYDDRSKKGWIETANRHTKRMNQKSIQDNRKSSHGKLLNSTLKSNKTVKKNKPGEETTLKRKLGEFEPNHFVSFSGEDGVGHFNDWLMRNGGNEKDKIPVTIVPSSKKPKPSLKMDLKTFADFTSASTAPTRIDARISMLNHQIVEKPIKNKEDDGKVTQDEEWGGADFTNMEVDATPMEEVSNHKESDGGNKTACKYVRNHKCLDELNLKEEDNNKFLNEGNIMHNLSCSQCQRRLVQNGKGHSNKQCVTIFNAKRTVLCCQELLTCGPGVCRFCICYDCVSKMYDSSDENVHKDRSTRRSRRNK